MRQVKFLSLLCLLLIAAACTTAPDRPVIGRVEVDGLNAYRNGSHIGFRKTIYDGDEVSTGPATSLKVTFTSGGYLLLDENTDPNLFTEGACIVIRILKGNAIVDAKNTCVRTQNVSGILNSRLAIRTDGTETELTLIEGGFDLSSPVADTMRSSQQLLITGSQVARRSTLSRAQVEDATAWSRRFFVAGYCCWPGAGVSGATENSCGRASGRFFLDHDAAIRTCAPAATPVPATPVPVDVPTGYCCVNRKLSNTDPASCEKQRGSYSTDQVYARKMCAKPQ